MHKDHSRQQQTYAIIDSPFARGSYLIVEVLQRDAEGTVLRKKSTVLAEQPSIQEAQQLLDQWNGYDHTGLVAQFERWQKEHSL